MKLYHCSNMDFDKIDLSKSKPNKDFGRAFYLSEHADEIKPVGKAKVLLHGGEFTMLEYEFDEKLLSDGTLRVLRFDAYTSDWAEFIFANRDFKQNFSHNYDVVGGNAQQIGKHSLRLGYSVEKTVVSAVYSCLGDAVLGSAYDSEHLLR